MKQRSITAQASDGFRLQVRVASEEIGHRLIKQGPIFGYPEDGPLALVHFLYKKIIGNRRFTPTGPHMKNNRMIRIQCFF
ncbi:hypothetical protein BN874_890003 [Candidatus Contendobacter odensis Run_B_J11]|uniref:Uncharacterized protein n=1 Tax=Candidatus Contendobacter odensis Run_B_J11 TaxID=1400861 RepID=A0A7U7GFX0_9GAMM|nr:hypothetical protein BN874_890003 [Candidatus Contendobacter odensis Run_B_J11]